MKCDYCGTEFESGRKYVHDPKNLKNFCGVKHLRIWIARHFGAKYFTLIHKVAE